MRLGVIGWPIKHSLSPRMHGAALRALGIDGTYEALAAPPGELAARLRELAAQGYRGLNVTIPHKQAVMPLLDEIAPTARAIGAVNTIVNEDGRLTGHNTDAAGFMRGLSEAGCDVRGQCVLVLGAGGAARAVVYALASAGAHVTIWNRTPERAIALADEFGAEVTTQLPPAMRCGQFMLIVNTTPVGMTPNTAETPLPLAGRGYGARFVYDLVYNPRETALLKESRQVGAQPIGGLAMLVYQGAESLRLWTGRNAPVDVMTQALDS
ncbi:MAG: shikimate dehydrogenase [Chloroflexi bacterium]|nr:shikimate dehydrogenase [Chloroflexota bacterium]